MADFTYSPDFGYKVTPKFNTLVKRYASGVDQARLVGTKKLRVFDFSFANVRQAERDAVVAFYDSHRGATDSFTMDIDGETVTGRFVEGSFSVERKGPAIFSYSFQFEEIV